MSADRSGTKRPRSSEDPENGEGQEYLQQLLDEQVSESAGNQSSTALT